MDVDPIWHGLKIGDWATWLAGSATLLAVCAAIGVPWIQSFQQRKERRSQEVRSAQILAIELSELFIRLRVAMIERRTFLQEATDGRFNTNVAGLVAQGRLWGIDELPRGADLQNLPYPVAPSIAALRSMLAMYNGSLERLIGLATIMKMDDASTLLKLPQMLDGSQAALARAAGHLAKYEPSYRLVNYFDKGDGTEVDRLEDYGEEL